MPNFVYIALDRQGRKTNGTLPADTRTAAMEVMVRQGLSPISIQEELPVAPRRALRSSTHVPQSSIEAFTRELANLLGAGLPLSRALHLLRREASHAAAQKTWAAVHGDVVGGMSLADALGKWPRVFSKVYVAMVRAGEMGGFLPVVLQQIAEFRSREQDLKGRVKAALVYPAVLAVMACGVMIFLLTFFIPKFSDLFADFGSALPWLTRGIVAASQSLTRYGPFLAMAVIALIIAIRRAMDTASGRRLIERILLGAPVLGSVTARFALVRFCRMLGTLLSSGVPMVAALRVAKEAIGNQTLADAVEHGIKEVQRGASLARSLAGAPTLFPGSVIEMVTVAEETGRLDKELLRLSQAYETDLDRQLRMLVALAEPLLLFVMAAIIGTIVIGMLLPIFLLQDLVH